MEIHCLQVGEIETNCYLLCDETSKKCAVIDPGDEAERVAAAIRKSDCEPTGSPERHRLRRGRYCQRRKLDSARIGDAGTF